jgi:CRP/FNR family transcriptional regulator, cyclic AMP receptor protein
MQESSSTADTHGNCDTNCPPTTQEQAETQSLYDLIVKQPFLKGLNKDHLRLLAASAMRTTFSAGQLIFQKGDPANRFYLILAGGVLLESSDKDGAIHKLQRLGPGDVLGWSWLFPPYYWHFDAVAAEATDAIFFYGTRLRAECQKNHELGYELMRRVSEVVISRLQTTRQHWIEKKKG